jgi:hypothetical protein
MYSDIKVTSFFPFTMKEQSMLRIGKIFQSLTVNEDREYTQQLSLPGEGDLHSLSICIQRVSRVIISM